MVIVFTEQESIDQTPQIGKGRDAQSPVGKLLPCYPKIYITYPYWEILVLCVALAKAAPRIFAPSEQGAIIIQRSKMIDSTCHTDYLENVINIVLKDEKPFLYCRQSPRRI